MNVGLGIESDISIEYLLPSILNIDRALRECFLDKSYGSDLTDITIGMILVNRSAISETLHPLRSFDYSRLKRVKHPGTGQLIVIPNTAGWDVKPDFESFSGISIDDAREYLCEVLITSTLCLDEHHNEFPDFEVALFRADFETCLRALCSREKSMGSPTHGTRLSP